MTQSHDSWYFGILVRYIFSLLLYYAYKTYQFFKNVEKWPFSKIWVFRIFAQYHRHVMEWHPNKGILFLSYITWLLMLNQNGRTWPRGRDIEQKWSISKIWVFGIFAQYRDHVFDNDGFNLSLIIMWYKAKIITPY